MEAGRLELLYSRPEASMRSTATAVAVSHVVVAVRITQPSMLPKLIRLRGFVSVFLFIFLC